MIPSSIYLFLFIVLIKVICFHLAHDRNKRGPAYGSFNDEEDEEGSSKRNENAAETENVVGIYFNYLENITYRTYPGDDERNKEFMLN